MSVESNANNFLESLSSGVDVRTGMYSIRISLVQLLSHHLSGPSVPITLSYNAGSSEDIGFGRGWSISLSYYNESSGTISLSTGQSFKIYKPWGEKEYDIPYRKLKDIKITYLAETSELKVVNKEGLCEYLSESSGKLKKIVSEQGKEVYFNYDSWTGKITKIYDNDGREIIFDWSEESSRVYISHTLDGVKLQSFTLNKAGNGIYYRLSSIQLDEHLPSIELEYRYIESSNYDVIEKVTHPSGLIEKLEYLDNGHSLPTGAPLSKVPYIKTHRVIPASGSSQPASLTEYDYSDKNYLGYASERIWIAGEDTLFKSAANYTYTTTELINNSKKTVRRYNKYHLLDFEKHYDNNVLYREDHYEYYANLDISIEEQPAAYSLPKSQTTTYYSSGDSRSATKKYEYDDYANPTLIQEVDGSQQVYIYYPSEGEEGKCPADPDGMVTQLREERFIPATTEYDESPLITNYTYTSLSRLDNSSKYFIVLATESDENQIVTMNYYAHSEQPYTYGRIKELVSRVNSYENKATMSYEYLSDRMKATTTFLTHDGLTRTSSISTEYYLGLPIEQNAEGEPDVKATYDSLGRKETLTVAPDTANAATTSFTYTVGAGNNTVTRTDAKGNVEITEYNNAGKTVAIKRSQDGVLHTIQTMTYNEYGQLESVVDIDQLNGTQINITSQFQYDVNGEVKKINHQDGRKEVIEQNLVSLTTTNQQVGLVTEITSYNLAGLEVDKSTVDNAGNQLARTQYDYDAFGKLRRTTDTQGRTTKYSYDVFDRIREIEREIDGEKVVESYSYPESTSDELVQRVAVNGVPLGERDYDGLGRLNEETVNGATKSYYYTGASNQPDSVTLPNDSVVDILNNVDLQVSEGFSVRGKPELSSQYSFDPQSALPTYSLNQGCRRTVTRDSYGRIEVDEIELNDGEIRQASDEYSLRGRLLTSWDYFGNRKNYGYDSLGRPEIITEHVSNVTTTTSIEYDSFSRPFKYITMRGADKAVVTQEFNSISMETQRIAKFNDVEEFRIVQTYNTNLQMETRIYTDEVGKTLETFTYDDFNRLNTYSCQGLNTPSDEYGNLIIKQTFSYDLYGNITRVKSNFNDNTTNIAVYTYDDANPVQLRAITNTHPTYPSNVQLNYDINGNMLNDERGLIYRYNELGQLVTAQNASGHELSRYQYDAGGRMVSQTIEEQLVYLFYSKGALVNETSGGTHSSYLNIAPGLVGRSVRDDANDVQHQFLLGNSQGSVVESLSTSKDSDSRDKKTRRYTPYGEG